MIFKCVSHNSFQEDDEESGREQTALSNSECGSEPVSYAAVELDCARGLVIDVLYHANKVDLDVVQPHGGPKCVLCRSLLC